MAADAKEGKDLQALAAIYREAQRVRLYGFTAGEYDRMKAEYLSQLESAYVNRNKVKNAQYGDELRDHYLSNEPIPSKEDDYQIMKQLIEMPALMLMLSISMRRNSLPTRTATSLHISLHRIKRVLLTQLRLRWHKPLMLYVPRRLNLTLTT